MATFRATVVAQVVFKFDDIEAESAGDASTIIGDRARAAMTEDPDWYIAHIDIIRKTPGVTPPDVLP